MPGTEGSVTIPASPRRAPRWLSFLAVALGLLLLYLLIAYLWQLVLTLIVAGAVYYLLSPLVEALMRRGSPRGLAVVAAYAVLVAVLVVSVSLLAPRVYGQVDQFARDLPEYAESLEEWLGGRRVAGEAADERLREALDALVERGDEVALETARRLLVGVGGFFATITAVIFGLAAGFYLLVGAPELSARAATWVPPERRREWLEFGRLASRVLAGYLRARLLASVFVGTSYGVAFALLGVNEAILLGVIGGVLNLVPVIGPILAAIPALIVAAFQSWTLVVAVLVIMVVAQQVESAIVNPHLEGHYVRLPPAVVVLVAAAGLALAGIPGLLLATPVAGLVRAALDVFYRRWEDADPPEPEPG
jgi:putative heme transporter